jgi:hypothetical protein
MNTVHETTVPSNQLARHTTDLLDGEVDISSGELVIRTRTGWIAIDWAELIRFRKLLFSLIWRDVKIRYNQTVLGVAWAILQPPLFTMVIWLFGAAPRGSFLGQRDRRLGQGLRTGSAQVWGRRPPGRPAEHPPARCDSPEGTGSRKTGQSPRDSFEQLAQR